MKPKSKLKLNQKGFTLVEMLVVISIMMLIATALIIDFNRQRGVRGVKIAQNETATNIRKVQGYTLSSRNLPGGVGAKFYVMEFNTNSPTSYHIGAVDRNYNYETVQSAVKLPAKVKIDSVGVGGNASGAGCLQLIFSVPYGTMYSSATCGARIAQDLQDPIKVAELNQSVAYIYFDTTDDAGLNKYIQINPFTGQISAN